MLSPSIRCRFRVPPSWPATSNLTRHRLFNRHINTQVTRAKGQVSQNRTLGIVAFTTCVGIAFAGGVGFASGNGRQMAQLDAAETVEVGILDHSRLPKAKYATRKQMEQALEEIRDQLPNTENIISIDPNDLLSHGYQEWSSVNPDDTVLPVAVAYPRTTDDVQVIARICHKHKIPIVPYAGGSSVEAQTSTPFGGISIDFTYMSKCLRLSPEDMDATVQPGLCWSEFNEDLASNGVGLFFPIDPAPSARFGGMVGTNCSGTNAVRYGTMRDWVLNVTMVLADGTIVKTRRRPRKCSAGYNLNGIIVGSEGTLGIVTEITIKLAPVPQHTSVAVVPFPSIKQAVSAATAVIQKGVPVAALELMDEIQMRIVNEAGATNKTWKEVPTLFFKFSGTPGTVQDNITTVKGLVKDHMSENETFEWATDPEEQEMLWSARKQSLYSLLSLRKEGERLWNTDVAVPLSRLADIVAASKKEADEIGLKATVKGHVGDSNFHENIYYNASDPAEVAKAKKLVKNMVARAIELDGTCTGEHGVGFGKKDGLLLEVGNDTLTVMKLLKATLDPHWIMNPGKVFDL